MYPVQPHTTPTVSTHTMYPVQPHTTPTVSTHTLQVCYNTECLILSYKLYLCDMRVLALIYILNAYCGLLTSHVWGWLHWFGM